MLKYARRFYSSKSLVKSEVPVEIGKVAVQGRSIYELQGYQQPALKEYFDQDALLFPVETIVEKSNAKDF